MINLLQNKLDRDSKGKLTGVSRSSDLDGSDGWNSVRGALQIGENDKNGN